MGLYGWRGRLGVIIPRNNTVVEPELNRFAPTGVSVHAARLVGHGATNLQRITSMAERIPRAIEELETRAAVFSYSCMTTSLMKPVGWHQELAALAGGRRFLPAGEAMVEALASLGAGRLGVFSPYSDDLAGRIPGWFDQFGLRVVANANLPSTPEQNIARHCEDLYPLIVGAARSQSIDAVAILATDLATFDMITVLEADLGVPVVSSNLALLWCMLRAIGVQDAAAPGTLFRRSAGDAAAASA